MKNATMKNFTSTKFLGPIRLDLPNLRTSTCFVIDFVLFMIWHLLWYWIWGYFHQDSLPASALSVALSWRQHLFYQTLQQYTIGLKFKNPRNFGTYQVNFYINWQIYQWNTVTKKLSFILWIKVFISFDRRNGSAAKYKVTIVSEPPDFRRFRLRPFKNKTAPAPGEL